MIEYVKKIAERLSLKPQQVEATLALLNDDCTIPFIARYRKEATGSLDEVALAAIRDLNEKLVALDKRREAILKSLSERNLLSEELQLKIAAVDNLNELEDLSMP